jgi:hypothetical protein
MKKSFVILACLGLLAAFTHTAAAQTLATDKPDSNYIKNLAPRPSPMAIAKIKLGGNAFVKVVYSRPFKKGREIFGGLVPFGQVWRTGANEATELTTTADLSLGGKTLKAGTYAVFTIPSKDKWTVIFNSDLGQWGAYTYDASKDVMRVDVPVQTVAGEFEAFTINLTKSADGAELVMLWDKTKVSVPVKVL